jgi:hypothetical protein
MKRDINGGKRRRYFNEESQRHVVNIKVPLGNNNYPVIYISQINVFCPFRIVATNKIK